MGKSERTSRSLSPTKPSRTTTMVFCCRARRLRAYLVNVNADKDLEIDGNFVILSTAAYQRWLINEGYSPGPVDGRCGCRTKRATKKFLAAQGYEVDKCGCGWSKTTVALQSWLTKQGYQPGPVDGIWGEQTSKAMQTALNDMRKTSKGEVEKGTVVEAKIDLPVKAAALPAPSEKEVDVDGKKVPLLMALRGFRLE